jgi:hypothetical protein
MNYKIVVASCDKNKDLFEPFYILIEKYWPDHPEIIYSTETVENPYYKTICKNYPLSNWTRRIRDTILELDCEYILLMCDDLFIREKVDTKKLESLEKYFNGKIAGINLEGSFDKKDIKIDDLVLRRNPKGKWKISVLCYLYNREKLIDIFDRDCSPWEIENLEKEFPYDYLILKSENILKWRDPITKWRWGLVRKGKWKKETKLFFEKENIIINWEERGFIK